jgi:poly(ribitol-phosphate) beta-N-acetylglucosaminyltransferase
MKISIIVPSYNAVDKIGRCLISLRAIDLDIALYEVLFVDDCSTDGTYDLIRRACSEQVNWRAVRLESNSGSPSRPRNYGIEAARGTYLYFLDCDDELLPDALRKLLSHAQNTDACIVRSELLVDNGRERIHRNRLPDWPNLDSTVQRCKLIMTKSSTVVNSFVKRSLLLEHHIRWPEHLRMGEDSVFLAEVLIRAKRIEYLSEPTFIYHQLSSRTPSSTRRYGRRELQDHLQVWITVQTLLQSQGIDYFKDRLSVGLRVALESLIFRNSGDVNEASFRKFHEFVSLNWSVIGGFSYIKRLTELLRTVNDGDYSRFCLLCRPRLVVAGHDLKFIRDAVPALEKYYDIRFDEWKGHEHHDEKQSKDLLDWAEYIWCEWLLKNAEWYSQHKRPDQRLVIRMHRMELGRSHGERLDARKVDAVITVSPLFFERLLERFPNIPRHKVRFLPNYVRVDNYRTDWHKDRMYTLGLIGILPMRKGYRRALDVLYMLRKKDNRFRLEVFGQRPEDLPWIVRDQKEMEYYNECEQFIQKKGLQDAVYFNGHVDVKQALAERRVGFVLSVSDSEFDFPGFESFHLAIADAFASLAIALVLRWPGAEYLWMKKFLVADVNDMADRILDFSSNQGAFQAAAIEGCAHVRSSYSAEDFTKSFIELYQELL